MSLFDIKSIVSLSHPVPNAVWATLCAIVLLGVLLRRVELPRALEHHSGKIWLAYFLLPVVLILALVVGDRSNLITDGAQSSVPHPKAEREEVGSTRRQATVQSAVGSQLMVPVSQECLAAVSGTEGVRPEKQPGGSFRLSVRRSVVEPDPAKRFTAMKIAEEFAKADLVSFARGSTSPERETSDIGGQIAFREVVRSLASGNLSGIQTKMSCYMNGTAWVVLETTGS